MNICIGICIRLLPVQVHVAPPSPVIEHVSVNVKDFCANGIWRCSFQLKKRPNISALTG